MLGQLYAMDWIFGSIFFDWLGGTTKWALNLVIFGLKGEKAPSYSRYFKKGKQHESDYIMQGFSNVIAGWITLALLIGLIFFIDTLY